MIREQAIIEWRREAPWSADWMVEQALVISRALVEMYSVPELADCLAFRGGTCLQAPPAPVGPLLGRYRPGPGPA